MQLQKLPETFKLHLIQENVNHNKDHKVSLPANVFSIQTKQEEAPLEDGINLENVIYTVIGLIIFSEEGNST